MSIATAITNAQNKVANAYTAVSNQGGTLPATQDLSNLPTAINSVNPSRFGVSFNDVIGTATSGTLGTIASEINLNYTGVTNLAQNALNSAYRGWQKIKSVAFPDLTTISGTSAMNNAFNNCTNLTSATFPSLTTISSLNALQYAFANCTNLATLDLSKLQTITGQGGLYMSCQKCTSLTSVDFSSLLSVTSQSGFNNTFESCTALTSVDLSNLTTVTGAYALIRLFQNCSNLASLSLPKLTTIGNNASSANNAHLNGIVANTSVTALTFPELQVETKTF